MIAMSGRRSMIDPARLGSVHSVVRSFTPSDVDSSSQVQDRMTFGAPFGFSRTSRANAASIAAMPPFTSQLPRPKSLPSRMTGLNGSAKPSVGTVS